MGLFDRFKKKGNHLDKDGNPQHIVVMEEKDCLYAPAPGAVTFLEDAEGIGAVPEGAAGIVVAPEVGALWSPLTGDVSFAHERGELTITNFLGVELLVRLLPAPSDGAAAFTPLVDEGAHVHVGDPLVTWAKADGTDNQVALLVTNAEDFAGVQPATEEPVQAGDVLMRVLRK